MKVMIVKEVTGDVSPVAMFVWYRNRSRKNLVPKKVSESVSKKMSTEKSLGIGLDKFWYQKKVSELVSKNFGTEKSLGIGLKKCLIQKKSSNQSQKNFVRKKSRNRYRSDFGSRHTLSLTVTL